jgi:hypothetical protein
MNRTHHIAGTVSLIAGGLLLASFAAASGKNIATLVSAVIFLGLAGFHFANATKESKASTDEELNRLRERVAELEKKQGQGSQE